MALLMAEPVGRYGQAPKKGVRERMEEKESQATVKTLETVAQHAYLKMAELIDGNHLEEARQVAEVLKVVGIV